MKYLNHFTLYSFLPILIGVLLGAALGYFGQCTSGACPLTSTWWRGAIYGGILGALFFFTSGQPTDREPTRGSPDEERAAPGYDSAP
jgi:hypothetical protein